MSTADPTPTIEWTTYIEPIKRVRAEVTEANVLAFCREYGWSVSYVEKKVPPHPDGRAVVMRVEGGSLPRSGCEVPFWVEESYDGTPRRSNAPDSSWEVSR